MTIIVISGFKQIRLLVKRVWVRISKRFNIGAKSVKYAPAIPLQNNLSSLQEDQVSSPMPKRRLSRYQGKKKFGRKRVSKFQNLFEAFENTGMGAIDEVRPMPSENFYSAY
eukprot:CAMPEP_0202968768 /NCGR_PEP_ID=MMETSP1396-20130829/14199_1 /ASSEMBLY_ACC=CAM_ASM_000872 /TAXON_ID= /ORGANISM="Pseudokeronopsis sp., Strain Brazil" /LENGTH=110 /DNA_ID=CAMNT_0049695455 /DNA_START=319 /DNA_END=651 /DNA_ORIENTATION=-